MYTSKTNTCPQCGGSRLPRTLVGYVPSPGFPAKDGNHVDCRDCGYSSTAFETWGSYIWYDTEARFFSKHAYLEVGNKTLDEAWEELCLAMRFAYAVSEPIDWMKVTWVESVALTVFRPKSFVTIDYGASNAG
jgi:hypothetical protein